MWYVHTHRQTEVTYTHNHSHSHVHTHTATRVWITGQVYDVFGDNSSESDESQPRLLHHID